MERMTKIDENILKAQNLLSGIVERCYELEEENKKLKDNVEFLHSCLDDRDMSIAIMQEENEKLKGLQICGKTVAERIEDDKKVSRE